MLCGDRGIAVRYETGEKEWQKIRRILMNADSIFNIVH